MKFDHWKDAMATELAIIELSKTWSVTILLKSKHSISCKLVYKIKYESNGSIVPYKACLVAKVYIRPGHS